MAGLQVGFQFYPFQGAYVNDVIEIWKFFDLPPLSCKIAFLFTPLYKVSQNCESPLFVWRHLRMFPH